MASSTMHYLSALVVLQIFLTVGAQRFGCPTLFDYYPHTSNCGRFFRCVWGSAYEFNCAPGTYWSQRLRTCDHWYNTPCLALGVVSETTSTNFPNYDFAGYDNSLAAANRVIDTQTTTVTDNGNNGYWPADNAWAAQGGYESYSPWFQRLVNGKKK